MPPSGAENGWVAWLLLGLCAAAAVTLLVTLPQLLRGRRPNADPSRNPAEDAELLAAVTGLGSLRNVPASAYIEATAMDVSEQSDLRGDRDLSPHASNPWTTERES